MKNIVNSNKCVSGILKTDENLIVIITPTHLIYGGRLRLDNKAVRYLCVMKWVALHAAPRLKLGEQVIFDSNINEQDLNKYVMENRPKTLVKSNTITGTLRGVYQYFGEHDDFKQFLEKLERWKLSDIRR